MWRVRIVVVCEGQAVLPYLFGLPGWQIYRQRHLIAAPLLSHRFVPTFRMCVRWHSHCCRYMIDADPNVWIHSALGLEMHLPTKHIPKRVVFSRCEPSTQSHKCFCHRGSTVSHTCSRLKASSPPARVATQRMEAIYILHKVRLGGTSQLPFHSNQALLASLMYIQDKVHEELTIIGLGSKQDHCKHASLWVCYHRDRAMPIKEPSQLIFDTGQIPSKWAAGQSIWQPLMCADGNNCHCGNTENHKHSLISRTGTSINHFLNPYCSTDSNCVAALTEAWSGLLQTFWVAPVLQSRHHVIIQTRPAPKTRHNKDSTACLVFWCSYSDGQHGCSMSFDTNWYRIFKADLSGQQAAQLSYNLRIGQSCTPATLHNYVMDEDAQCMWHSKRTLLTSDALAVGLRVHCILAHSSLSDADDNNWILCCRVRDWYPQKEISADVGKRVLVTNVLCILKKQTPFCFEQLTVSRAGVIESQREQQRDLHSAELLLMPDIARQFSKWGRAENAQPNMVTAMSSHRIAMDCAQHLHKDLHDHKSWTISLRGPVVHRIRAESIMSDTSMWQFVRDCVSLYRSHTQPFTRFDTGMGAWVICNDSILPVTGHSQVDVHPYLRMFTFQ